MAVIYPEYALQWPPELELVKRPKRVRWIGTKDGEPAKEDADHLLDDLDPESKALRALEDE